MAVEDKIRPLKTGDRFIHKDKGTMIVFRIDTVESGLYNDGDYYDIEASETKESPDIKTMICLATLDHSKNNSAQAAS